MVVAFVAFVVVVGVATVWFVSGAGVVGGGTGISDDGGDDGIVVVVVVFCCAYASVVITTTDNSNTAVSKPIMIPEKVPIGNNILSSV